MDEYSVYEPSGVKKNNFTLDPMTLNLPFECQWRNVIFAGNILCGMINIPCGGQCIRYLSSIFLDLTVTVIPLPHVKTERCHIFFSNDCHETFSADTVSVTVKRHQEFEDFLSQLYFTYCAMLSFNYFFFLLFSGFSGFFV